MQCLQLTRGEPPVVPPSTIAVTITGRGDSTYCYVIINDAIYHEAGTHEVNSGDRINFGVFGRSTSNYGSVTIDGTEALRVTNGSTKNYSWKVPSGISTIKIAMKYTNQMIARNGRITVTTA